MTGEMSVEKKGGKEGVASFQVIDELS